MTDQQKSILNISVDLMKSLLTTGSDHKVDATNLADLLSSVGNTMIELRDREEGTVSAPASTRAAAPQAAKTVAPATPAPQVEAPVAETATETQAVAPSAPAAEPAKRGRKKATEAQAKPARRGRPPKNARTEAETTATSETVAQTEAPVTEMGTSPDPNSPNYKFRHLREKFGVNPDGSAKRFNDLAEEDTFDGEEVISLFDGTRRKMLRRHLNKEYSMSPKEYNTYFGLSKDYRVVGPDFSSSKSSDAKVTKLGHKRDEETAQEEPIASPTPAKVQRRTRARAAA